MLTAYAARYNHIERSLYADMMKPREIDRFGNLVGTKVFPVMTSGRSNGQAKAIIGDVVKEIVDWAVRVKKPIVKEQLDFPKKKALLHKTDPKHARMLSTPTMPLARGSAPGPIRKGWR